MLAASNKRFARATTSVLTHFLIRSLGNSPPLLRAEAFKGVFDRDRVKVTCDPVHAVRRRLIRRRARENLPILNAEVIVTLIVSGLQPDLACTSLDCPF